MDNQPSLSSVLQKARQEKGLTLSRIELDTRIRSAYIDALENRKFEALPPKIYRDRIVKRYAQYLGIDHRSVLSLLHEELKAWKKTRYYPGNLELRNNNEISGKAPRHFIVPFPRWNVIIGPKTILLGIALVVVGVVFAYIINQYAGLRSAPTLVIYEPTDGVSVTSSSILITGQTDPGTLVTINDKKIDADDHGYFQVDFDLIHGTNTIAIVATNNSNKKSNVHYLNVEAILPTLALPTSPSPSLTPGQHGLTLELHAEEDTWIRVLKDDEISFEGILLSGERNSFRADNYITLKAGNAGGLSVTLNGIPQPKLGALGEVVTKTYGDSKDRDSDIPDPVNNQE